MKNLIKICSFLFDQLAGTTRLTPASRRLINDALREMMELLVWGDQHDPSEIADNARYPQLEGQTFFDFFLEKQVAGYFLTLLRMLSRPPVSRSASASTAAKSSASSNNYEDIARLLQTLIMLFENVTRPTSLYYLLSNHYVNEVIVWGQCLRRELVHEEALAYYVTLLKTLSLRLDYDTLAFFFNPVCVLLCCCMIACVLKPCLAPDRRETAA